MKSKKQIMDKGYNPFPKGLVGWGRKSPYGLFCGGLWWAARQAKPNEQSVVVSKFYERKIKTSRYRCTHYGVEFDESMSGEEYRKII